jgi:hypothetical protein
MGGCDRNKAKKIREKVMASLSPEIYCRSHSDSPVDQSPIIYYPVSPLTFQVFMLGIRQGFFPRFLRATKFKEGMKLVNIIPSNDQCVAQGSEANMHD